MKATTLALSTMAFGIMIGVTATHFQHVNHLVENGVPVLVVPVDNADLENEADTLPEAKPATIMTSTDMNDAERSVMPDVVNRGNDRDDTLFEILTAIRSEQQAMRRQISESNRDIDELTFRVDTHSDSFKPLNAEMDRPRSLGNVLVPGQGSGGVLPPKH